MQNFVPHTKWYHITKVDGSTYSKRVYELYEKLSLYNKLRKEGCSELLCLEAIGTSRATYYRWIKRYRRYGLAGLEKKSTAPKKRRTSTWTKKTERIVLETRRTYRLWGKAKLAVMIRKEHKLELSVSTVGRILKKLLDRKKIQPAPWFYGAKRRKPRTFSHHAKRWKYGMKARKPGELLQVDHMTVEVGDKLIKHFQAVCPVTKVVIEQAYRRATSSTAARFLEKILEELPFPLLSLQVDGGSEFMGLFEQLCKEKDIPLFVLPPRRPKYNGSVERSNGIAKYEFYSQYHGPCNLHSVREQLQTFVKQYNEIRPHQALNYLTPKEFCSQLGLWP